MVSCSYGHLHVYHMFTDIYTSVSVFRFPVSLTRALYE